jgi:hypothetical protein
LVTVSAHEVTVETTVVRTVEVVRYEVTEVKVVASVAEVVGTVTE